MPEEPTPCYNPDITDNMGNVERRSMEAEWENHKAMVTIYNAVQEWLVDKIAGACDKEPYLKELWDEYAQFDERTAREMLDHIMTQVKQKLTSNGRSNMRAKINADCDQTQDIRVYLKNMERSKTVYLAKWGIIISDQEMTSAGLRQINSCSLFTSRHKRIWDDLDLDEEDQTWEEFKAHFTKSYDEEMK